jgi:death on curing protein
VVETVSAAEVLRIYDRLVADFATDSDPISPAGLRSEGLLESAVGRQFTGGGQHFKYPDAESNAATLLFGLCHDHPFMNGNKRTALVAMLAHLDKNQRTLVGVGKDALFDMILGVANHTFVAHGQRRRPHKHSDDEVAEIAEWIKGNSYRLQRGEKNITYRQLRAILLRHRYTLENPKSNFIELVKIEQVAERRWFSTTVSEQRKKITSIPYSGENRLVGIGLVKHVRRKCELTESDGCDSTQFYEGVDDAYLIDGFINEYRTVLRRLARR